MDWSPPPGKNKQQTIPNTVRLFLNVVLICSTMAKNMVRAATDEYLIQLIF